MSDHESLCERNYETPIPALDDHRHNSSSAPIDREHRVRRSTFESQQGGRRRSTLEESRDDVARAGIRVRDFEEAVIDDDAGELSPGMRRTRRPTINTATSSRDSSVSPPNSVKAFAEARRREREMSFSEQKKPDAGDIQRTMSIASRHSHRSRPQTMREEEDGADAESTDSAAEEDVCFPPSTEYGKKVLYIDFDYLDEFIRSEAESRIRQHSVVSAFPDARPELITSASAPALGVTSDGDILEMPSDSSASVNEKTEVQTESEKQKTAPQHDPNRFSFFSSTLESTIHAPELADLVLPGEDIRHLFTFPKDETDGVWWLNICHPTDDEIRAICKAFGIHPLTIEDITTQETREKIELFPSYYFANFRSFSPIRDENDEPEFEPFNIYLLVFREGTLSFSFKPSTHAHQVRKRIATLKDYVALSSDWICYAMIDNIVDSFGPVIQKIESETDAIEDEVFVARFDDTSAFLRRIGVLRKNVMALMRLLGGKADVLKGFTKRCNENYQVTPRMDIGLYLGDIQDHVVTMMTNLGHFEKMLSRSHSNYLAQLSVNSITQGTRANKVLGKVTLLASIIVPLNVITGLFGMNVSVPWSASSTDSLYPFIGIVLSLVAFCVIALFFAWRFRVM